MGCTFVKLPKASVPSSRKMGIPRAWVHHHPVWESSVRSSGILFFVYPAQVAVALVLAAGGDKTVGKEENRLS